MFWRLDAGDDASGYKLHEIVGDGTSFSSYHITYLRKPNDIDIFNSVNCELHETLHPAIVDKAVELLEAKLKE